MSNYPVGAENNPHAPFNKEELQGETIGLFEYLENLEIPYEVRCELKKFKENRIKAILLIKDYKIKQLLSEPQIFIEE